jgi:hypothetical protein
MSFEEGVAVSLFYEDGAEISAYPVFAEEESSLLLWLMTEDCQTIYVLDEDQGRFVTTDGVMLTASRTCTPQRSSAPLGKS